MKARSDHGNYWYASKRFVKLRAAALRDQRVAACARLFDENRERTDAEAIRSRAPTGIMLRPDG